jgi:hypothetical protein
VIPRPGDRIRIIASDDHRLVPDAVYGVSHVDDFGHIWLDDPDPRLHLCHFMGDRWELVEEKAA